METYDLWVLGAIFLAFVLVVILFLKTPKNERTLKFALKQNRIDLEKKLQSYPSTAQAVIIKGNKKEAFYDSVPMLLYFIIISIPSFYLSRVVEDPLCHQYFGINGLFLMMILSFYGFQFGFFLMTIGFFKSGLKTVETGYCPPLDSVVSQDTIATKTRWSKLRGYFAMATPFVFLIMIGYSHITYMDIVNNEPTKTYQELFEKECN